MDSRIPISTSIQRIPIKNLQHKRGLKRKKILTLSLFLFCSTGLIVHGWLTTRDYLLYPVTSVVIIHLPLSIKPPAVSLCFDLKQIMNESSLPVSEQVRFRRCQEKEKEKEKTCLDDLTRWMARLDPVKLMKHWTLNLTKFNDDSYTGPLSVQEYYRKGRKCFKYSRRDYKTVEMHVGVMDNLEPIFSNLMEIWFHHLLNHTKRNFLDLALYIHQENQLSHLREGNALYIRYRSNEDNYLRVTYDCVESHILKKPFFTDCINYKVTKFQSKKPFFTDCIDYKVTKFQSRGDCLERCYETNYVKKYRENYGLISTANYSEIKLSVPEVKYDHDIDKNCYNGCKSGCETINYVSTIVKSSRFEELPNIFAIPIAATQPYIYVHAISAFNLNNYVIYMASITSLWLGWSLFGTTIDITNFVVTKIDT